MWLSYAQAQQITRHAQAESPREVCGIIAGRGGRATEIIPIPNAAEDPQHTYVMEPSAFIAAMSRIESRGLDLVGFYHSHPHGDPVPSHTDIQLATYPDTPYLIVGLKDGARLAAWQMRPGQVDSVPLTVGDAPEPPSPALSLTMKIAILASALIAVLLVIVVSLSLLPPAPIIPR